MCNVRSLKSNLYHKKCRIPFFNNELSVDMLEELIYMFSPQSVAVVDHYVGTMKTAIASLRKRRKCLSVGGNTEDYTFAFNRLR